ncbi:MAG: DUF2817 domain-containing protein [Planctomycetaceae bacterium]|nr:DUF2817 domain-containing protein [Planctomycetaceae bacterium]
MIESAYSSSYAEARRRFIESAHSAGAELCSYSLRIENATSDELTIDVAILGPDGAPALVTSSGLHGVEGFLGSAIQLARLHEFDSDAEKNIRWVFIHAINPFGFARIRRFNEKNVDLNRNFLLDDFVYSGAPADYARLNRFLNPITGPTRYEPYRLKAMWNIVRYGMDALKQSIAGGQYEYPRGIFYGGAEPSQAMEVIRSHCEQWIGSAQKVLHVDFHSGLGKYGEYKLLLAEHTGSERCRWYESVFGHDSVEATDAAAGIAYRASGPLGEWLQHHFSSRNYRFVTAEFGTYEPIRVLAAIRAENRAHHYGTETSQAYQNAKQELTECFCPADPSWRQQVVTSGLDILQQGISGLRML